ncbi:hypothetical protein BVRB_042750, partial [Beta vulgaris subsp. vulgaris]
IDALNVIFEESPLERAQQYRRWIALNSAGRRRSRRILHRCRDATLHANNIEDGARIQSLRRSSISRSKSDSLPRELKSPNLEFTANLDPLDDPFMDRFDQLQLLASERIQWALAVLNIGHSEIFWVLLIEPTLFSVYLSPALTPPGLLLNSVFSWSSH